MPPSPGTIGLSPRARQAMQPLRRAIAWQSRCRRTARSVRPTSATCLRGPGISLWRASRAASDRPDDRRSVPLKILPAARSRTRAEARIGRAPRTQAQARSRSDRLPRRRCRTRAMPAVSQMRSALRAGLRQIVAETHFAFLDGAGRIADIHGPRIEIVERASPRTQHRAVANRDTGADKCFRSNPRPIPDHDRPCMQLKTGILDIVGAGANVRSLRGERIRRKADLGYRVDDHLWSDECVFVHFEIGRRPDAGARIDAGSRRDLGPEQAQEEPAPSMQRRRCPRCQDAPGHAPRDTINAVAQREARAAAPGVVRAGIENVHRAAASHRTDSFTLLHTFPAEGNRSRPTRPECAAKQGASVSRYSAIMATATASPL